MIFSETPLNGAFVVELEAEQDERGYVARAWCRREFSEMGLVTTISQCLVAHNPQAGTLRGLHYQRAPHEEVKLVRCIHGAVFDVIVDLRSGSPTYKGYFAIELNARDLRMLYVPAGMAHGYQTLEADSDLFYQLSAFHAPKYAAGVRWDDPAFGIDWPATQARIISARDRSFPDFTG